MIAQGASMDNDKENCDPGITFSNQPCDLKFGTKLQSDDPSFILTIPQKMLIRWHDIKGQSEGQSGMQI